jgi:hypothetical protein
MPSAMAYRRRTSRAACRLPNAALRYTDLGVDGDFDGRGAGDRTSYVGDSPTEISSRRKRSSSRPENPNERLDACLGVAG